jgi:hypothetical protein
MTADKNSPQQEGSHLFTLYFSDYVKEEMAEEMIAVEDVEAVIEFSERTNRKFVDEEGINIGHRRLGIPTVWVEYKIIGDNKYQIVDVYSHRVQIEEPGGQE